MNPAATIIDQNEIVSGAVHFCEAQYSCDCSGGCPQPQTAWCSGVCPHAQRECSGMRLRTTAATQGTQSPLPDCISAFTYSAVMRRSASVFLAIVALTAQISFASDYSSLVLEQIKQMPQGGRYSVSHFAKIRLESSAHFESGKFFILPSAASPSFCSGATYLVFIRTIEVLRARGELHLDYPTLEQLIIRDQRDGEGIWGRWNANGPGTARLFHELGLGRNFTDFSQAQPGDFMKIFWNMNVGKSESGHSVIFLGTTNHSDGEYVRFWSSNIGMGYGEKEVPRSKIANAIFSRLETPANLTRVRDIPVVDDYLASLLRKKSNFAEASKKCGI